MESLFDPRERSPLSIVVEMDDPSYCESKAIELISEAKQLQREIASPPDVSSNLQQQYDEKMAQAISLLVLARVQRGAVHS